MLYVDCTRTASGGQHTGIERYVRRTLRHAHALLAPGQVAAMTAGAHGWSTLPSLAAHPLEALPAIALDDTAPRFDASAHVLLADRFWHTGAWEALDLLLASPARITLVVYDLLSIRQPGWFPAGVGERFRRYLRAVLPRAGRIVCLSGAARADLLAWMRAERLGSADVRVVAPGHEVWDGPPVVPARLPAAWQRGETRFVLQVGTLEPRKNHELTLAVLRDCWARGENTGCLFVGQRGWLMESFVAAMKQLPQWQRQLLWLAECSDAELQWCYRHAAAVFYPSASEGYGLPLAEAAMAGALVIASDTPVHREVARSLGPGARVRLCELQAPALAHALRECLGDQPAETPSQRGRGWLAATADLLECIGLGIGRHGFAAALTPTLSRGEREENRIQPGRR